VRNFSKLLIAWFPFAILATLMSALVYLTVQQDLRLGANDPQLQIAQDTAVKLQQGASPTSVVTPVSVGGTAAVRVDGTASLATFSIIYDSKANILASGLTVNGSTPQVPSGVFNYVNTHGEDRFTWEPTSGVRIAAVVEKVADGGGYVLAGRSLSEVENRQTQLTEEVMLGWVVSLVGTFLASAWGEYVAKLGRS
jgi:hypothetical protein